jgi:hypothetical protein
MSLEGKEHIVPWGYSLGCNTLCVNPSIKWDIYIMCLLLQVFDFLGEAFHFSQDLFGRAYGRFIITLLSFANYLPSGSSTPSSHEMRDTIFLGQYTRKPKR